jgi:hypothetical protein
MNIFEVLLPIGVLASIGTSIYMITKAITDFALKKKMVEKGFVNEESQSIFKQHASENKYSALKWGIIVLAAGIALIIIDSMHVSPDTPLPYGVFAICLSVGFLVYYAIIKKELR